MRSVFLALLLLTTLYTAKAQPTAAIYKQRVQTINANINQYFSDKAQGLYYEQNENNKKPHSYLWPLCALIQAANEMEALEPSKSYMKPVMGAIDQYYNDEAPAPGYQAYPRKEEKDARFYDDNQWIAIAAMDAYKRNKQKQYLDVSKLIYRFMMSGYDTLSGGGIYWKEDEKTSKNTCSNGPGILVALQLYEATKQKTYLDTAIMLYKWTNQHLLSPEGVYYDNISIPGLKTDKRAYTYNTGTMLQSNVLLYKLTKNKAYLTEAQRIAKAAETYFYKNEKLPGLYWFNAVLLRGYIELYQVDKNKQQLQFLINDAERIWQHERDDKDLLGSKKIKTLIDQAAMMEIYARLARVVK